MFIERLLNQGSTPLIEQAVRFSAARQKILTENVANIDVPGYLQKDLSVEKFQELLRGREALRDRSGPGSVSFDDVMPDETNPKANILFHDRGNRSIEQLMSDSAKNAMFHNMMIEMLRKQINTMEIALKERIG